MKAILLALMFLLHMCLPVSADIVLGTLVNDDDPYIVRSTDGTLYKVEWYSGDSSWDEGERVVLSTDDGQGKMISRGSWTEKGADVWVEEIDED